MKPKIFLWFLFSISLAIKFSLSSEFSFPTWDGAFYINYFVSDFWKWVLHPGYPVAIQLFSFLTDPVTAAQTISILASCVSIFPFYSITRRFLEEKYAYLVTFLFASTPVLFHYSLVTYSESLYVLLILLAFERLIREQPHYFWSGVFFGLAYLTRPEAFLIFAVIAAYTSIKVFSFKIGASSGERYWGLHKSILRQLVYFLLGGLIFISSYVGYLSVQNNELTLTKKTMNLREWSADWKVNIQNEGREATTDLQASISNWPRRSKEVVSTITESVGFVTILFVVGGLFFRPSIVGTAFLPLLILPFFGLAASDRFIVPYIPFFFIFSFVDIVYSEWFGFKLLKIFMIVSYCIILLFSSSYDFKHETFPEMKELGVLLPPEKVYLDRKPFVAFFAKGEYKQIPNASIDSVVSILKNKQADYLVLSTKVIPIFRPNLNPLFNSEEGEKYNLKVKAVRRTNDGGGIIIYEYAGGK